MDKSGRIRTIVGAVVCAALVGWGGTADANWFFSHGNVSEIESPANCTYRYFGWGLDLTQKSGLRNWIHMTVPTPANSAQGARYIRLRFYRGSADVGLSQIDVYNGSAKVKQLTGFTTAVGWNDRVFDLGTKILFSRGMGISILVGAGVESMNHRLIFSSAGADFY